VDFKGHTWEVDEFHGDNEGLVVAEIELKSENEDFAIPDWIGKEVTPDERYYNMNLATHPYKDW
jgi:adenylate cyclase